jgi:predicted permease
MLLECLVPRERRAEALGDLCEDYGLVERQRGRWAARAWLFGEAASLARAWVGARVRTLFRTRAILLRDARLAWRALVRRPLSSVSAATMLGVGIVAVGVALALGHALLDRPVSETFGHRVQRVAAIEASGRLQSRFSAIEVTRIEAHLDSAAAVGAVGLEPASIRVGSRRRQTLAEVLSPRYSEVIGMTLQIGRPLLKVDHDPGSPAVAIISDVLWRELFGRESSVLDASILVNGRAFGIAGVARPGPPSSFLGASVDVWVPLAQADVFYSPGWRTDPERRSLSLFVLPALPQSVVEARLSRATLSLTGEYPTSWRERSLTLGPGTAMLGSQRAAARQLFRILLALALLILVVAGANVSGMLLAGAAVRRREAAIDIAIGAGPGAAPRRLLAEGAWLGAAAALVAWGLYAWARVWMSDITLLPTLSLRLQLPEPLSLLPLIVPAATVVGMSVAIGPALWARRQVPNYRLHLAARSVGDRSLSRVRRLLIGAQVAVALVLLVGATLLQRSLDRLSRADLGVSGDGLLAFDFDIEPQHAAGRPAANLAAEALRQTRAFPGVTAAAMANRAPVDTSTPVLIMALPDGGGTAAIEVTFNTVTSGYFETVGTPVIHGRSFFEGERDSVVIVNEALAERLWSGGDALGRTLRLVDDNRSVQVVGIARNARYRAIDESGLPHVYLPTRPDFGHALLVKTSRDPGRMMQEVQDLLDGVGPGVAGFFPRTLRDHLAIQLLPTRVASAAAAWFGGFALVLCAMGLYGLITWFVALRHTEMAVRLALGATRRDVEGLVLRQAFATAAPGLLGGLLLSAGAVVLARGLLYGVGAVDAVALVGGLVALMAVVAGASWWPAYRAGRTDPASALRTM